MSLQLGIATGCNIHVPIAEMLDVFAAAGVTTVEIGTPPRHFDVWDPASVRDVSCRLRRLGMRAVSIHAPFGGSSDLTDPLPERRHAAIGGVLVAASALSEFGGGHVIVHTSDVAREGSDVTERLRQCAASLQIVQRSCEQLGVKLVVETPLPHLVGGHPDEFAWVLSQLDEGAGVCIDTGHVALGRTWDRFVEVTAGRLVHIHANDNHGHFDDHLVPGDGAIDWTVVRQSLGGFRGCAVLELSYDGIPSLTDVSRAFERARNLLG